MAFLYDNLIATVVSMTVLLILASIQMRATSANVAQSARNMALNQTQSFATWLEQDVGAMGRNMESSETIVENVSQDTSSYSPTDTTLRSLRFYYRNSVGGPKKSVDYQIQDAGTRTVDGKSRPVYSMTRNGTDVGPEAMGYFDVQFIDGNAGVASSPSAAQAIRVQFSVIAPFHSDESTLHEVHRMVVVPYLPAGN